MLGELLLSSTLRVERWVLHPGAQGWEWVGYGQDGLRGQALLHWHGYHDGRGRGGGHLGVHLL